MSESLLNPAIMMQQAGDDIELVRELTDVFLETSDELISEMESSLLQANWPELARASHTLKSPLGFFGADASVAVAQSIEAQADAGGAEQLKELVDALRRDVRQLQSELRQHFDKSEQQHHS